MVQSDEFISHDDEHFVYKLKKSLFGLKHSPRCWNSVLHKYLESLGFEHSGADPCVYVRNNGC